MKFKKTSKTPFHRYAFSKRSNVCIFAAMLTVILSSNKSNIQRASQRRP
jgi:hypothetical protein